MSIDSVFRYRTLLGKCDLGLGLDLEEIGELVAIESRFAPSSDDTRNKKGRRFRREPVSIDALMRGDRINDRVELVEVGPGGFVVRHAPFVARGEQIELTIDLGENSYRFRAQGVWMKDDGDDYKVGLALIGMPVCLHKVAVSKHVTDAIDEIAHARKAA